MTPDDQIADLSARLKQAEAERDEARKAADELSERAMAVALEKDAALAKLAEVERERDEARKELGISQSAFRIIRTTNEQLKAVLSTHHEWHLNQTERTPVYFGDTIGQVNADEYQDSEMYSKTIAALPQT